MVSRGKKKRGVGVMGLAHVKNPIKLAREMLLRGEKDLEGGNGEHRGPMSCPVSQSKSKSHEGEDEGEDEDEADAGAESKAESKAQPPSGGAQGHSQLFGASAEKLAQQWGLEMVSPSYFFTQNRWDEHIRGLEREKSSTGLASWDAHEYVPQGTCGAVALDADGVLAVATSTGGMTNKLSGRIGDTPTLGAGFWAEEWEEEVASSSSLSQDHQSATLPSSPSSATGPVIVLSESLKGLMADCLPSLGSYTPVPRSPCESAGRTRKPGDHTTRGTALSGTGNGDSFLRLSAARTASAIARYRPSTSLSQGIIEITGPGGELEKSAGDRWRKTGEGEGGMIGIELAVVREADGMILDIGSEVVEAWNCGGMFRAVVDEGGRGVFRVWSDGEDGLDGYVGEGRGEDLRGWRSDKRGSGRYP
jgi:L-asparaginase